MEEHLQRSRFDRVEIFRKFCTLNIVESKFLVSCFIYSTVFVGFMLLILCVMKMICRALEIKANQKENSKRLRQFFKIHNPSKVVKVDQVRICNS